LKWNYCILVFKGGGIRCVAYLGVLKELERLGFMEPDLLTFANFEHFYGEGSCFQGTKEVLSEID